MYFTQYLTSSEDKQPVHEEGNPRMHFNCEKKKNQFKWWTIKMPTLIICSSDHLK